MREKYENGLIMLSFVGSHNKEGDNLMKSEIRFKDREHLAFYNMVLKQTRKDDPYHKAFFYVVGAAMWNFTMSMRTATPGPAIGRRCWPSLQSTRT